MSQYDVFCEKVSKLNVESQKYYHGIEVIECKNKCGIHANEFTGVHCESCFGDIYEIDPKEIKEVKHKHDKEVEVIACYKNKCRLRVGDGSGYHCKSCFGSLEDNVTYMIIQNIQIPKNIKNKQEPMTMEEIQSYMNEQLNRYKLEDAFKDKLSN